MKLLKNPYLALIAAYALACFAWMHGGWYGIFMVFFVGPVYLLTGLILSFVVRHREDKNPRYVANKKIRPTFIALLALLVSQNLITPALTDNVNSTGTWSLFTGFSQAAENSSAYDTASLFLGLTNLAIIACLITLLVLVLKDRKTA